MKLAFFFTSFNIGGVERVMITLGNHFAKQNLVIFYVCNNTGALKKTIDKNISIYDLNTKKIKKSLFQLINAVRKTKPDYIFTGGDIPNLCLCLLRPFIGKTKIIISQHNYFNAESVYILNQRFTECLIKHLYKNAYKIVAVSDGVKRWLNSIGIQKNVIKIYNPIDFDNINEKSKENIEISLPKKYAIFCGRFSKVKNLDLIIKAFSYLKDLNKELFLVLVGDGSEYENIQKSVENNNLTEKVIFTGSISNPYPLIANSKILLLSSTSECFPVILLEALALGKPVLSTKTPGALEILSDVDDSFLINDFDNYISYGNRIITNISTEYNIENIKRNVTKFDVKNIMCEYELLFS